MDKKDSKERTRADIHMDLMYVRREIAALEDNIKSLKEAEDVKEWKKNRIITEDDGCREDV
jgi:hypothetical protein